MAVGALVDTPACRNNYFFLLLLEVKIEDETIISHEKENSHRYQWLNDYFTSCWVLALKIHIFLFVRSFGNHSHSLSIMNAIFHWSVLRKARGSYLLVSRGRPSLLTLRGMTAPLSSLSADKVFPTELPRLMARLGVWGCGEAVRDCWGLLDVLCHLLLLLRKGNLYSKEPLSLLLPLYSDTGMR